MGYREFQRADYLPAEIQIRAFLQDVAKTGSLRLSYRSQWLLARFWKCVLPEAAQRLTPAMREELRMWVPGATFRTKHPSNPKG